MFKLKTNGINPPVDVAKLPRLSKEQQDYLSSPFVNKGVNPPFKLKK